MTKLSTALLTITTLLLPAAAHAVQMTQTERDVRITATGPQGYALELNKQFGTWRHLIDASGASYDMPDDPTATLAFPSLNPSNGDLLKRFGNDQLAGLKVYPDTDGDNAIQNPVAAWNTNVSLQGPQQNGNDVVATFANGQGNNLTYTFTENGIVVKPGGNHGAFRVVMLVPVPDALGAVKTPSGPLFLQGQSFTTVDGNSLDVMSPYRAQAMRISFNGSKQVFVEMQDGGKTPERAVLEYTGNAHVGIAFTVSKDESFTIAFPDAQGAELETLRALSMQPKHQGLPSGATRGVWLASSSSIAEGEDIVFTPVRGATLASLSTTSNGLQAQMGDVSNGDYDFFWKQVSPNGSFNDPGDVPFPSDEFWKSVNVDIEGESLRVHTAGMPAGVYKLRIAIPDAASPDLVTVEGDLYVAIGQEEQKKALFAQDGRKAFLVGETVELSLRGQGTFALSLEEASGAVTDLGRQTVAGTSNFRLDTAPLKPGMYRAVARGVGKDIAYMFSLTEPERESTVAIEDNSLTPAPYQYDLARSFFGGTHPSPWRHGFAKPFADIGLSHFRRTLEGDPSWAPQRELAVFASHFSSGMTGDTYGPYSLANPWFDSMVENRVGYWQGVQSRALSFTKVTLDDVHVGGLTQRLARTAQQLRRWPTFGGMNIDVDVAGTAPELGLKYAEFGAARESAWQSRMQTMMDQDFEQQFAQELAQNPDVRGTERLWTRYLAGLWSRTNANHQAALKAIDPNIKQTSNTEYNHAPTREGMYPPMLYKGLDFTSMEAWGDMRFNPLHNAYWSEIASAVKDLGIARGEPTGPVWMEGQSYAEFTEDHLPRHWFESIGCGADGVGYAANIFGLNMYGVQSHVADEKRDIAIELAKTVQRLGPLYKTMTRERDIAILYSFNEGARAEKSWYAGQFSNELYVAFYTLTHAQLSPTIVFEESIREGMLSRHKVLMVAGQTQDLPADVMQKIAEFQANGGVVIGDKHATINIPGMRKIDGLDFAEINQSIPTERFANERYQRVRQAIEDSVASVVQRPGHTLTQDSVLYWFKNNDARYLIALNNKMLATTQEYSDTDPNATWDTGRFGHMVSVDMLRLEPHTERMYLRDSSGVVINMVTHEPVEIQSDENGAYIELDYSRQNYNLFAFFPSDVPALDVQATTVTLGGTLQVSAKSTMPLPVTLELMGPDGQVRGARNVATNQIAEFHLGANESVSGWAIRATDWVTGRQTLHTLRVQAPAERTLLTAAPDVIVYDAAAVKQRLANAQKLTIVVDSTQPELVDLANELKGALGQQSINADVWFSPTVVTMPIDWNYGDGDNGVRSRVFNGDVIGQRYWRGNRYEPSWELRKGHHIARDVILLGDADHNRFIKELQDDHILRRAITQDFPGEGHAVIQHVMSAFSAKHGAIVVGGKDVAGLRKAIAQLASVDGNAADTLSATRGRFLKSLGFGAAQGQSSTENASAGTLAALPVTETTDVNPLPTGPSVNGTVVSPNASFVAVSVQSHGNNVMLMNQQGRVKWRVHVGGGERPVVRAVTNAGTVALNVGKDSEVRSSDGSLVQRLMGERILWIAPNGRELVTQTPTQVRRIKVSDKSVVWSFDHGLPDGEYTPNWDFVADPKNTMLVGPNWNRMLDPHEEIPHELDKLYVKGVDLRTGRELFKKDRFAASSVSFSRNGRFVGIAKKRLYFEADGSWQRSQTGAHDSVLVLMDTKGRVIVEKDTGVQVGRTLPSNDGRLIVGVPYQVLPYALIARSNGSFGRIKVQSGNVRDGCLMENGYDVALVSDDGVVRVFDQRRPLWTFEHAVEEQLWCDHPQMWLGTRDSTVTRMTKRGVQVWQHDLAEDVLQPEGAVADPAPSSDQQAPGT